MEELSEKQNQRDFSEISSQEFLEKCFRNFQKEFIEDFSKVSEI